MSILADNLQLKIFQTQSSLGIPPIQVHSMRSTQSNSKLLNAQSAGKSNRAQGQKELRQAQRLLQTNHYSALQDTDFTCAATSGAKSTKHIFRSSQSSLPISQESSQFMSAGPSSSMFTGVQSKSSLQAARAKIASGYTSQQQLQNVGQSNLFGGLSRHLINASATTGPVGKAQQNTPSHHHNNGSTDQMPSKGSSQTPAPRQAYQHNSSYLTQPTSPNEVNPQTCARTLAALDQMNQCQQKMRKSESQSIPYKTGVPSNYVCTPAQPSQQQPMPQKPPTNVNPGKKLKRLLNSSKQTSVNQANDQQAVVSANPFFNGHSSSMTDEQEQDIESEQRSYSALQQLNQSPLPHPQFSGQNHFILNDSIYSHQTFAKRQSFMNQQLLREAKQFSNVNSNQISRSQSIVQAEVLDCEPRMVRADLEKTGSFNKEDDLSQSEFVESKTNPELTTPSVKIEPKNPSPSIPSIQMVSQRPEIKDQCVGVYICCHEQAKEHAVLLQKVQFLNEQINEEKTQSKMKEHQYNKIIAALKQTAEENNGKRKAESNEARNEGMNLNSKEIEETFKELNEKKEEVNKLQEQVLELELKNERQALDFKILVQQKEDEISEEKLKLKHKESDLRNANAQVDRLNEDIQNRIQEALDRQSDRLGAEKQADLEAINRRNEQLIKQLVDNHCAETRQLRDFLLEQERKRREAEHQLVSMEIELRSAKLENNSRFDAAELEEIQAQNSQLNEIRLQTLKSHFTEENQQLRDVILQLENHINRIQEDKSESERKLIIAEDKIDEVTKEVARNKILMASHKVKEEKMQQTFKAQIAKERKTADIAVKKVKGVEKLEAELNKKQIQINDLKAKILEMESDEKHRRKLLIMKRRQIEDEKTVLIKKQAMRQRSMTKSNLSATRLKQQVETQMAVIQTERNSKKALLEEKEKLERQINSIKREKTGTNRGDESSRHNESMSMYFARSQHIFSPHGRGYEKQTKSFVQKGCKTTRHAVFMSQQQLDHNQLHLSKQFSGERTSSAGPNSLQCGDSMVNIVEFEENTSPKRKSRRNADATSILSTPFRHDEPIEQKASNLKHSQSQIGQPHLARKTSVNRDDTSSQATPIVGAGVAQFQTQAFIAEKDKLKSFKTMPSKQIQQIQNREEEFIHVLSGCDTSNDSIDQKNNRQSMPPTETVHVRQMTRKDNLKAGKAPKPEVKEVPEIKLIQGSQSVQGKGPPQSRTKNANSNSFAGKGSASMKEISGMNPMASPSRLHLNLANKLAEQRLLDSKQSFVRTVLTARQECQQFNQTIRQKDEHALTSRNQMIASSGQKGLDNAETSNFNQAGVQFADCASEQKPPKNQIGSQTNPSSSRHFNRNLSQQHFFTQGSSQALNRKSVLRTPLNYSNDQAQEMSEQISAEPRLMTQMTPVAPDEPNTKIGQVAQTNISSSFNGLLTQQITNMTSPQNYQEDTSVQSKCLLDENILLKEQLEAVKKNLAEHQQKTATTELTMMEAIMQMKDQITHVIQAKLVNPEDPMQKSAVKRNKNKSRQPPHEDYLVMQRISRNSTEEDLCSSTHKPKTIRQQIPQEHTTPTDIQSVRKTNSLHLRQRSDTFDLTLAQAESMYKKIKIKSPNKRVQQNNNSNGMVQLGSATTANLQKQTTSSAMKRQSTGNTQKSQSNVSSFTLQTANPLPNQTNSLCSQSFFQGINTNISQRLSMGVLKQSMQQSVKKMSSNKQSAQKSTHQQQQ